MQAMIERDRRYKLGALGPRIEIDNACIGGEGTGEESGRSRRGHTPFIVASRLLAPQPRALGAAQPRRRGQVSDLNRRQSGAASGLRGCASDKPARNVCANPLAEEL